MIPLPIANGLYNDRSLPVSHQICKNWYSSPVQTEGLSQQVLYGTPGLIERANTGGTSRISRGAHTKEGIPYFVQGDRLYSVIKTTPLGVSTYTPVDLGYIAGTGRVSMADNGNQLMIVGGDVGYIYNEADAVWTESESAASGYFGLAYGANLFVGVSISGTGTRVQTSPDGITWTLRTSAADLSWRAITYGDGLFVAVAASGTGNRVMTSPDGITWTSRTSSVDNGWKAVTYGNGLFVAVSDTGTGDRVMTSPDGITWTTRVSAADNAWTGIAYGNGLFVAVSGDASGAQATMTSPDGITWTNRASSDDNEAWNSIAFGDGKFVASASTPTNNSFMVSDDGLTWRNAVTDALSTESFRVAYGNGLFVGVSYLTAGSRAATSTDGINWEFNTIPSTTTTVGRIVYGGDRFVSITSGTESFYSLYGGLGLQPIPDSDFYANGLPRKVRFVDSYFAVTTNVKKWIRSAANDGLNWNALDFGTAEADPDNIQAIEIDNNDVYIFGTETVESFDNIGGSGFGFQRNNLIFNKGATSPDGVIKTTNGIAFLGAGKDESPAIWSLEAGSIVKISHPGIDNLLNGLSLEDLEACFAQYYAEAGAFFVSFTFPSITIVYDFASEKWHQRESSGLRWRVNSLTTGYGTLWAGDSIDGRIGEMALDIYHEYGNYIEAQVSSPNFSNQGDDAFYPLIELTMEAGMGNADTPDPVVTFDWSNNGKTFQGARARSTGVQGDYTRRSIWRQNGNAPRFRTNRFTYTGKTKRTIIKLEAEIEA